MDMFSALAEPTRRTIIEMLASRGQLSVTNISNMFHVSPSAISQHLKILREAKLIDVEKHAQQRLYKLNPHTMYEVEAWASKMSKLWNNRFKDLDNILEEEKKKLKK